MNLYLKAPLVLGGICVVSAGLLGGVNLLAKKYKESLGDQAPKSISVLDPNAKFEKVTDFKPFVKRGDSAKVTVETAWKMVEGGNRTGYAFEVNAGKAVKSEIKFTVSFKGEISESTINDVKPYSVHAIALGDSGFDGNAGTILEGSTGDVSINDYSSVVSGGTISQKFVVDGLRIAREAYLNLWTGAEAGPVDETLELLKKVFADAESYKADEFTELTFGYKDVLDERQTGHITKRYTVTLEDGSTAKVYQGNGSACVNSYSPDEILSVDLMVGFKGEVTKGNEKGIQPAGYVVVSSDFSYSQWKDNYLPGIADGSIDLDNTGALSTGATISTKIVANMMKKMRNDYYTTTLAAQEANVVADFEKIYGADYASFVKDADFTPVAGAALKSEKGTYDIADRFTITLKDGTTVKAYKGSTACEFESEAGPDSMATTIIAGFKADGKVAGVSTKNVAGFNQWVDGYIPGIVDGSTSLDDANATVGSGATRSANAVRELLIAMREDMKKGQAA